MEKEIKLIKSDEPLVNIKALLPGVIKYLRELDIERERVSRQESYEEYINGFTITKIAKLYLNTLVKLAEIEESIIYDDKLDDIVNNYNRYDKMKKLFDFSNLQVYSFKLSRMNGILEKDNVLKEELIYHIEGIRKSLYDIVSKINSEGDLPWKN